jgi:NitT/TauT family transport system ATP-binding protein
VRLVCQDVGVDFAGSQGVVPALRGVTFGVRDREFVSIVGPTGCGKTTLLKALAGLRAPTRGTIQRIPEPGDARPETALVFQDHGLFPWLTILDNVAFGLEARGAPRADRRRRAEGILETFGLGSFARAYPHQLSVGMRQKAALARALLLDPQALLLDEPFASVDFQTRLLLHEELLRIWTGSRRTVVFVTHDLEEAVLLADRVVVLTGRPARVREEINIPLARPRRLEDAGRREADEIKWRIWRILEHEARLRMAESA